MPRKKKEEIQKEITKEELPTEEIQEDLKDGYSVGIEEDGAVHVRPIIEGEAIDTPIEKIEQISLDNRPVDLNIQEEPIEVDKRFAPITPQKPVEESKIKLNNSRVYKDLGNGYGMYADNGEVFRR